MRERREARREKRGRQLFPFSHARDHICVSRVLPDGLKKKADYS